MLVTGTGCSPILQDPDRFVPQDRPTLEIEPVVCDYTVGVDVSFVDGLENYADVKPGDTICIEAGTRPSLKLRNFRGESGNPIVVINSGGTVVIQGSSDDYAGIDIRDSEYIRVTGTGVSGQCGGAYLESEQQCGFVVLDGSRGVAGINRTGYIEIDHVEVNGPSKMGVNLKSKDENGINRSDWIQYDTYLHHNYIHETGTEGFYVGSSFYSDGLDPVLDGVEVSHNLIVDTGWDGLQVGSATKNCTIHHNRIVQASQLNNPSQRSSIMNNRGSVCHIYNNLIIDGLSRGIYIQGNGGNQVYNNVIVRPGRHETDQGDGIVVATGSNNGESIYIWNNTIVEPKRHGIIFRNDQGDGNLIQNNLIVGPGASGIEGDEAYIDTKDLTNVVVSNNLYAKDVAEVGFADPAEDDYSLLPNSPAVDAGIDLEITENNTDYLGVARFEGQAPDIGAFEYRSPFQ